MMTKADGWKGMSLLSRAGIMLLLASLVISFIYWSVILRDLKLTDLPVNCCNAGINEDAFMYGKLIGGSLVIIGLFCTGMFREIFGTMRRTKGRKVGILPTLFMLYLTISLASVLINSMICMCICYDWGIVDDSYWSSSLMFSIEVMFKGGLVMVVLHKEEKASLKRKMVWRGLGGRKIKLKKVG